MPASTTLRRPSAAEWRSRPLLSFGLRALVFITPVAVSLTVVSLLAQAVARPQPLGPLLLWWALLTLAGLTSLFVTERLTRQLLPLAALLRLSLLFPDHAPARFAVARRAARPKQILRQLEELGQDGRSAEVQAAQAVLELSVALSVHDRATRGHSERVQVLTDMISKELHLPEADRARLRWGALLHDIGKLKVPARILNKPAKPTEREWATLRRHPAEGARIVAPILPWLGVWGLAVVQHHEWYDGSGYPKGLKGPAISKGARIVAVADVFEVITAPRAYRRPISIAKAREELVRVSGSQLDPKVVRAFLNVSVGELWPVVGLGAVLCQLPLLTQAFGLASRLLPGLAASTATAGAAGALLVVGISHPGSAPAPSPQGTSQGTSQGASQSSSEGASQSAPLAQPATVKGPAATPPSRAPAAPDSAAPTPKPSPPAALTVPPKVPTPTPTAGPPPAPGSPTPTPLPAPTPTPSPLPSPTPSPSPAPLTQLLTGLTGLLRSLGL
jgi:putative nucleotidyltransferase with HDIG domain